MRLYIGKLWISMETDPILSHHQLLGAWLTLIGVWINTSYPLDMSCRPLPGMVYSDNNVECLIRIERDISLKRIFWKQRQDYFWLITIKEHRQKCSMRSDDISITYIFALFIFSFHCFFNIFRFEIKSF